jgi:branched-chain amino acid aminotransferase
VIRRPDRHVLDPTVKSNNYLNNIMALIEGTGQGGLMESLVLTRDGYIAEATVDNVFCIWREPGWEKDPSRVFLRTPRSAYCLNGITRALVLHMARQRGYQVEDEADLLPLDLVGRDREVFMTGTGAGVMPIIRVAGQQVGDGKPGPVTWALIDDVRKAMADPAFGISLKASRQEIAEYLMSPSLLGSAPQVTGAPA